MRMTAANSSDGDCIARNSATPIVTPVPRDCPTSAIREGGIPSLSTAKRNAATPSLMTPSSEGVPEERPKPR